MSNTLLTSIGVVLWVTIASIVVIGLRMLEYGKLGANFLSESMRATVGAILSAVLVNIIFGYSPLDFNVLSIFSAIFGALYVVVLDRLILQNSSSLVIGSRRFY